jgi:hypothetical protein
MIKVVNNFLHKNFKEKNVIWWLESSFQPKGARFNPFPNRFCQQTKWMKKYIDI